MTNLLKKGCHCVISQLCSLNVKKSKPYIPLDLERVIGSHSKVFVKIQKIHPPIQENDHVIELIIGSLHPYI